MSQEFKQREAPPGWVAGRFEIGVTEMGGFLGSGCAQGEGSCLGWWK